MTGGRPTRASLADAAAAAGLAGVALGFLKAALDIPTPTALWAWYDSPGLTPALLSAGLLLQSLFLLARSLPGLGRGIRGADGLEGARSWGAGRVLVALAFCVAFVALMGRLPFGVLVAALVFAMTVAFRGTDPPQAAVLAVLTAVAVVLVFGRLFFVPLP